MAARSFIGRKRELQVLGRDLDRRGPSVVIVLRRRRVGKSRLLMEAIRGRPTIYYQATSFHSRARLPTFEVLEGEGGRALPPSAIRTSSPRPRSSLLDPVRPHRQPG